MLNPFAVFDPRYLPLFRQKGVKAFVKQTYDRGRNPLDPKRRPAYLLIHCNKIALAKEHYDAIRYDSNRQLFVISDPSHYASLAKLLNSGSALFYTMLLTKDANKRARRMLEKEVRAYVKYKTSWHPSRWDEVVFSLDLVYGEVYVNIRYGSRTEKIKIEELENQGEYVL